MDPNTLQAARAGDRKAQGILLTGLQDAWYRMSLGLLSNPDLAHEATQETAIRFLKQLPGFRGESQLRTWSLGICLNVSREIRRWTRDHHSLDAETHPELPEQRNPAPEVMAELSEDTESLRSLLVQLPDRQREAIILRYFEDLSVEQTAQTMQCAPGTVKATVHQALRSLRQKMERKVTK